MKERYQLENVSTFMLAYLLEIMTCHYNHTLSIDATSMVSRNCPIIGEHVGIVFMRQ